jgi:putative heme-binding domain-containing protein
VTDIAAGPDGAMWIITGGRKTQSALYRVAYSGELPAKASAADEPHERAAREHAVQARKLRLHYEAQSAGKPSRAEPEGTNDPLVQLVERIVSEQSADPKELDDPEFWRKGYETTQASKTMGFDEEISSLLRRTAGTSLGFETAYLFHQYLDRIPEYLGERRITVVRDLLEYWPDEQVSAVSRLGNSRELRRRLAIEIGRCLTPEMVARTKRSDSTEAERMQAEAVAKIATLLKSEVQEDRLTALLALRHVRDGWTETDRRVYFETLNAGTRFVGGQGMPTFLAKLREDALASLSEAEKTSFADVINPKPPEPEPPAPARPIKKKWTLDELAKLVGDPSSAGLAGDAKRGAVVFRDALCSRCHRAGLTGPAVGPDLTMVARRFSRRDMLQSIVTPSAAVAENYRNSEITTEDGRSIVGRVVVEGDFRSEKLLVNTDPLRPTQWVEIDKKQIAEHREATTSPMPEGLLDSFKPEEIADLLAFLEGELRE